MAKTIGLISIKGGVGKTTLSAALAAHLANRYGKRVLLVDANYSAPNLGLHMDIVSPDKTVHDVLSGVSAGSAIHSRHGVDVIPGSFVFNKRYNPMKLRDKLAHIKKKYDFVVLDSSPSLNDEVLSTMLASDELFVVSTPDYPTLSCSLKAAKLAKQRNKSIAGVIINRIDNPDYEITLEEIQESTGIPVVARIGEDRRVRRALFLRNPASLHLRNSSFTKELDRFSMALIGHKEKKRFFDKVLGKSYRKEQVNREVMRKQFYESIFES